MAVAYNSLTVDQLKGMLAVAKADYTRQISVITLKWGVEVTALRKALAQRMALATAEIQTLKNNNAALARELSLVHEELLRANTTITEQEQKLKAHNAVAALERQLNVARRAAS